MQHHLLVKQLLQRRRLVFGFIYALTRDVEATEEIFQDVSLAVLEESARETEVPRFLAWVCQVARHRVSDYYRKRSQQEPVSSHMAEAVALVFEHNEESPEEAARRIRGLLECVENLPARQREIIELRYRHRKPIGQVASNVGWKADAVKVALAKIRKSLLECLRGKNLIEEAEIS